MATKLETEVELSSPPEKFWESLKDSTNLFPKIFPQQYQSIQVLEGDGKSAGSIRLNIYAPGNSLVKFAKEKIVAVDEANKLISYRVIEGDILNYFKSFDPTLRVVSKGEGAVLKFTAEYEKVNDEAPDPELIQNTAVQTFKELDEYVLKN